MQKVRQGKITHTQYIVIISFAVLLLLATCCGTVLLARENEAGRSGVGGDGSRRVDHFEPGGVGNFGSANATATVPPR